VKIKGTRLSLSSFLFSNFIIPMLYSSEGYFDTFSNNIRQACPICGGSFLFWDGFQTQTSYYINFQLALPKPKQLTVKIQRMIPMFYWWYCSYILSVPGRSECIVNLCNWRKVPPQNHRCSIFTSLELLHLLPSDFPFTRNQLP
jgi:hypothetical protein